MTKQKIGFIGLGNMGGALARRLLLTHPLVVWDLHGAATSALCALGASVADSAAALARERAEGDRRERLHLDQVAAVRAVLDRFAKELIEKAEHFLHRVGLADRGAALASTLPHGDQRKLEVAMLLALAIDWRPKRDAQMVVAVLPFALRASATMFMQ